MLAKLVTRSESDIIFHEISFSLNSEPLYMHLPLCQLSTYQLLGYIRQDIELYNPPIPSDKLDSNKCEDKLSLREEISQIIQTNSDNSKRSKFRKQSYYQSNKKKNRRKSVKSKMKYQIL